MQTLIHTNNVHDSPMLDAFVDRKLKKLEDKLRYRDKTRVEVWLKRNTARATGHYRAALKIRRPFRDSIYVTETGGRLLSTVTAAVGKAEKVLRRESKTEEHMRQSPKEPCDVRAC